MAFGLSHATLVRSHRGGHCDYRRKYIVMAYIVMAYIVMSYVVMAYVVMAYIVMASMPMPDPCRTTHVQAQGLTAAAMSSRMSVHMAARMSARMSRHIA